MSRLGDVGMYILSFPGGHWDLLVGFLFFFRFRFLFCLSLFCRHNRWWWLEPTPCSSGNGKTKRGRQIKSDVRHVHVHTKSEHGKGGIVEHFLGMVVRGATPLERRRQRRNRVRKMEIRQRLNRWSFGDPLRCAFRFCCQCWCQLLRSFVFLCVLCWATLAAARPLTCKCEAGMSPQRASSVRTDAPELCSAMLM